MSEAQVSSSLAELMPSNTMCLNCANLIPGTHCCAAFPDIIPWDILMGVWDHRRPFKGDRGILFEAVDPTRVPPLPPEREHPEWMTESESYQKIRERQTSKRGRMNASMWGAVQAAGLILASLPQDQKVRFAIMMNNVLRTSILSEISKQGRTAEKYKDLCDSVREYLHEVSALSGAGDLGEKVITLKMLDDFTETGSGSLFG